jgi:hypothetical protein
MMRAYSIASGQTAVVVADDKAEKLGNSESNLSVPSYSRIHYGKPVNHKAAM